MATSEAGVLDGLVNIHIKLLKHRASLYNQAEVFSLPIINLNERPMLTFDWVIRYGFNFSAYRVASKLWKAIV